MSIYKRGISVLSVSAVILYPCLFIYFQNAGEAKLTDIGLVSVALLAGAWLLCGITWLLTRKWNLSFLAIALFSLVFMNFAMIEGLIKNIAPNLFYWHVLLLMLFIWGNITYWLVKKCPEDLALMINGILLLVFSILIMLNGIFAIPVITEKLTLQKPSDTLSQPTAEPSNANQPNIYYFLFDEYGGLDCLSRYCGYDNTPFYTDLETLGFNVSTDTHNETYETVTVIPNLLNLDYVNTFDGVTTTDVVAIKESKLKNPPIYQIMRRHGYALNILDSSDFLDREGAEYQYTASTASVEQTAAFYILQKTALYPFYYDDSSDDLLTLHQMMDYAAGSPLLQSSNLFTLGYFCNPHVPWFVDEDGNPIDGADRYNYNDPSIYLGQLKYLNKLILSMVSSIIEKDPDGIIILQSDHGYRVAVMAPELVDSLNDEFPYITNTLNVVYLRGEPLEIEGATGINTLRTVINQLFGENLEMINPASYPGM